MPTAKAEQGHVDYEVNQKSQNIFSNDLALVPNDSTDAPSPLDTSLNGTFVRVRSNGNLVAYVSGSWVIANKANIISDANTFATNADNVIFVNSKSYTDSQVAPKINTTDAVDRTSAQTVSGVKNFNNGIQINGGFTNPYKSYSYIAPAIQNNPTLNVQGQYIQLRMSGDLGGFVNDAAASEIRLSNVSNTGTGQSAHENSVVISGGVNNINLVVGTLSNIHTENSPTGSCTNAWCVGATQTPVQAGFTYGTMISGYFQSQIAGTNNYTLYADGGNSVIPIIVPKDINSVGLIVRGLTGQVSAPFAIQNSLGSTTFSIGANGTGGIGGTVSGASFWFNNNNAATTTVNLALKAGVSQTGPFLRYTNSSDTVMGFIDVDGGIKAGGATKAATAIVDVQSTTKGFLPPRMTTTQKNAIVSPAEGLQVYDLTLHKMCFYNGTAWETITSA